VMTDLDVSALVDAHRSFGAEATLHLIGVDDPSAFGVVDLAADGSVRAFVEKPAPGSEPSNLINAGTYVFEASVLERIPRAMKVSVERDTFPRIVADGGLFGVATDDYWIDAGVPSLYRAANLDLLDGKRRAERCEAVAASAVVADDAIVRHSIVGERAHVASGASVVDSVLLPGASVATGATIERSLVMGHVGANAMVRDSMVGADGHVGDGQTLVEAVSPGSAPDER
jgi:mannose-1-phosphate guanylyltransferase